MRFTPRRCGAGSLHPGALRDCETSSRSTLGPNSTSAGRVGATIFWQHLTNCGSMVGAPCSSNHDANGTTGPKRWARVLGDVLSNEPHGLRGEGIEQLLVEVAYLSTRPEHVRELLRLDELRARRPWQCALLYDTSANTAPSHWRDLYRTTEPSHNLQTPRATSSHK